MAYITPAEANAYADHVKLNLTSVDSDLEASVAAQVLAQVSAAYDTSSWTDFSTTPSLVRKIIAMYYVAWYYQRTYSEDEETSNYGLLLQAQADRLIEGIVSGKLVIEGVDGTDLPGTGQPLFYPTDLSSSESPTLDDPSLGPARFTIGQIW